MRIFRGFRPGAIRYRVIPIAFFTILALLVNRSAQAATFSLPDGQANVPGQFNDLDLDLGGSLRADDQRTGARLTFPKFSDHVVLFVDTQRIDATATGIALGDEVDVSGQAGGGGFFITGLPNWRNYTLNLRLSGQSETLDVDSNIVVSGIQAQTTLKNRSVAIAILLSPVTSPFSNGANFYVTLGASYQRMQRNVLLNDLDQRSLYRYEQEYLPQLAAGIVYPVKRFSFYASAEYDQDLALGLGIRLQLTNTSGN